MSISVYLAYQASISKISIVEKVVTLLYKVNMIKVKHTPSISTVCIASYNIDNDEKIVIGLQYSKTKAQYKCKHSYSQPTT